MSTLKHFVCLAIIVALSGCASVPFAPTAQDNSAKQFAVQEGKANIYVVQDGGYGSGCNVFQVSVNGQPKGSLAEWSYHFTVVDPGTYTIIATSPENEEGLKIQAEAGKNYFVSLKSKIGWNSMQVNVSRLDETQGRKSVLKSKLAEGVVLKK